MTVSYLRQSPTRFDRAPEPLLFLHGIGGGARSFTPQLQGLSDRFDCIAWDAPGYGQSSRLPEVTFPALADAVCNLLDELELSSVHLVGHSLGGMIGQELAATRPERLKSLVLSCTSPAFGRPDGEFQKKFIEDRLGPIERGMSLADNARELMPTLMAEASPEEVELAIDCMAAVPVDVYAVIVRCLMTFDRLKSLPAITTPTLALAAENDRAAPPLVLQKMASKIPGARFVCIPNAGHLVNMELPDAFNREVRRFLDDLCGP